VFLVSLDNLRPYANGYKATLKLGNPLSVAFDGAEIGLRWGPQRPSDFKVIKYADWMKQFKTSKQSITKRLLGGSWNPVDVVWRRLRQATSATLK